MDPGLIKLLEDDEDENTLPVSGAAVDAFAAELNRDVIGGTTSTESGEASYGANRVGNGSFQSMSQATPVSTVTPDKGITGQGKPGDSSTAASTQPQQQNVQWQNLTQQQQQELLRQRKQRMQQQQQQQQQRSHPIADTGSGAAATTGANSEKKQAGISYGISFSQLMPLLHPHLPPGQGQQLTALFQRFKSTEISREDFVRGCRAIAGDQMLVQTIRQMQLKQMQQAQQIRQQKSLQQSGATQASSEQGQQSPQQDQGKVKQLSEQDNKPLQATPLQQSGTSTDVPSSTQPDLKTQSLVRQTHQQLQQVKAEPQTSQQSPSHPLQASLPSSQLQPPNTEQQQGSGQLPQSGSQILDTVKNEVDKQLKQQQQVTSTGNALPVAIRHPLTAPVISSTGTPQAPQILKVGPQAQPLQSQLSAGGGDKPMSKYQKQKQRKKLREEEELRIKKQQVGGVISPPTQQPSLQQQSQNQQQQVSSAQQLQSLSAPQPQLQTPSSKQSVAQSVLPVKQESEQLDSQKRQASQSGSYLDILGSQGVARSVSDSGAMGSLDLKDSQKGSLSEQDVVSSPAGYNPRMTGSSAPPAAAPLACAFSQETSYAATVLAHSAFPASSKGSQQPTGAVANRSNATGLAMQNKQSAPVSSGLAVPAAGPVHMQGLTSNPSIAGGSGLAGSLAVKTPMKKPITGQKKGAESVLVSQPPSKKQKVVGGDADQSIDQLNDVTAVSGVNLREEEEQLLAGPKEESRTTDAVRRLVREEEDRLFLEKGPLRVKINDIAKTRGIRVVNDEVERCLSMAAEEVLRSMMYKLIKLSKQRCDSEKDKLKVVVTSDARRQLLLMRKKEKEALERKQAEESERLRKMSEKKDKGTLADAEKEELRAKAQKAQQEEEDKMRTNAANMAARAAVGVDDMLSKWQLLAEQGRQKRQGGDAGDGPGGVREQERRIDVGQAGSGMGPGRPERNGGSNTPTGRPPGPGPGSGNIRGRPSAQAQRSQRNITLKDVIACLEREPNLAKSTMLYRLYERESKPSSDVADRTNQGMRR